MDKWLNDVLKPREEMSADSRSFFLRSLLRTVLPLFLYGGLMGSWGMWDTGNFGADQWVQVLFSAVKLPLLLVATFLLSLPSIYILYMLSGLMADFRHILCILIATQGTFSTVLLSLSPLALLWYGSTTGYVNTVLFHVLLFSIAAFVRQIALRRNYREILALDSRHRMLLRLWSFVYAFVGVQGAWLLRPFVGVPGTAPEFIREASWGNAYVEVMKIITSSLVGN